MSAENALGRQFTMMRPSQLVAHAGDRSDKMSQAKVNVIADSIGRRGYRASMHNDADSHIHLQHTDGYPYTQLTEGNHRVHAMVKAGYDKPVPVRVSDTRTK